MPSECTPTAASAYLKDTPILTSWRCPHVPPAPTSCHSGQGLENLAPLGDRYYHLIPATCRFILLFFMYLFILICCGVISPSVQQHPMSPGQHDHRKVPDLPPPPRHGVQTRMELQRNRTFKEHDLALSRHGATFIHYLFHVVYVLFIFYGRSPSVASIL